MECIVMAQAMYEHGQGELTKLTFGKHPGLVLAEVFLRPRGITQSALARVTGISQQRVSQIVLGKRIITAETAERLAAALGTSGLYWMMLQADHQLELTRHELRDAIAKIESVAIKQRFYWHR
jgi:addiction module HigA family antidote